MSTQIRPIPENGAMGIRLQEIENPAAVTKEDLEERDHYIFHAGAVEISLAEVFRYYGVRKIMPRVITQIPKRHFYWDRDQDHSDTPSSSFKRHPSKDRKHEVQHMMRGGQTAAWLEGAYGSGETDFGLRIIRCATGATPLKMATISSYLLPRVAATNSEVAMMVNEATANVAAMQALGLDEPLLYDIAEVILEAVNAARIIGRGYLGSMKGEMEMRRVSGGVGIAKLDRLAEQWLKVLEENRAEFEVDPQAIQRSIAGSAYPQQPQVIQVQAPAMDHAAIAAIVGSVITAMKDQFKQSDPEKIAQEAVKEAFKQASVVAATPIQTVETVEEPVVAPSFTEMYDEEPMTIPDESEPLELPVVVKPEKHAITTADLEGLTAAEKVARLNKRK